MLTGEEKFVRSGSVRLWTERLGHTGDPTVLLVMGPGVDTSARGQPTRPRAAHIPAARLAIVPGMGHHPFFAPGLTERITSELIRHTT